MFMAGEKVSFVAFRGISMVALFPAPPETDQTHIETYRLKAARHRKGQLLEIRSISSLIIHAISSKPYLYQNDAVR
jgi:hypothetical protein